MRFIYDNFSHESCQNNIVTKQLFDFNIMNCKDHNYCTNNGNDSFPNNNNKYDNNHYV